MAALAYVDEETWGEKLARIHRRSKTSYDIVAERLRHVGLDVSPSTLSRLHNEDDLPDDSRRRLVATAYIVVLGYEPAAFGLDDSTLPPLVDLDRLKELLSAPSRCTARSWAPTLSASSDLALAVA